ncbi:MAG: hypothetical protein C0603_04070 [Denitrovibrio sp.]|nr:MAG: hypothetical protein C0603_04070 [Denitrovibrio sp.]
MLVSVLRRNIMLLLKDLPDKKSIKKISKNKKGIDTNSAVFSLQFLKKASDAFKVIDRFFNSHDLSQGRFLALTVLYSDGKNGLFPFEVADLMGVTRATASGLLKGLQTKGYIVANQSETDGRMKRVSLTDLGKEKIETLTPEYYKLISKFTGKQDKKVLKEFSMLMCDMSSLINEIE